MEIINGLLLRYLVSIKLKQMHPSPQHECVVGYRSGYLQNYVL